jgi:putative ABC transport system permease protein
LNALAAVAIALRALRLNALRSMLAMLGIIIGVASVIVMVSIGNGAKAKIDAQIAALGTNTLLVVPGSTGFGGRRGGAGTAPPFKVDDVEAIAAIPSVTAISGVLQGSLTLIFGGVNWVTQVYGVDQGYFDVRDWAVEEGRLFTADEARTGAKVAVLGKSTARELFGDGSPIGEHIRIRNVPFQVIGVLSSKGQSMIGQDQDDNAFVPASVGRRRLFGRQSTIPNVVRSISVKIESPEEMDNAQADITELMRQRRRIRAGAEDNFRVQNLAEFIRARTEAQATLGLLLGATALIALFVGGIGIMNIMLVSVTERTREIGLRMAVGARSRAILSQFLIEAVTLCAAGGTVGILLGIGGTLAISRVGSWDVGLDPLVVLAALASSALVGVFFGFYPARKASRLNPIDALRHE